MTRKQARDEAFKLIYQMQIQKEPPDYILKIYYEQNENSLKASDYIDDIVKGVYNYIKEIDGCVSELLEGWRIERVSKISISAIRLSAYEIMYRSDIPGSVSVNEAVQLAKKYEGEQAASFVNGVLAGLIKKRGE